MGARELTFRHTYRDPDEALAADLPDSELLAIGQLKDGLRLLHEDKSTYPRFKRLQGVDTMTSSMAPGEIWVLGAKTGSGKSLLCQNLMDDLIEQEVPTLYIGTEQDSHVLKVKHCCVRAGVSAKLVLKPRADEVGTSMLAYAEEAVEREMQWLASKPVSRLALFANTEYVNRDELNDWIRGGVRKYGLRCVIVDHIDQVQHGDGVNPVAEITASIQLLHDLAREFQIPMVVASQLKRHPDPFKRFSPPDEQDFAGCSAKERIASVLLGIWRPLRTDLSIKDLRALRESAKEGGRAEDAVYQPNTMGVRLLKDRLGAVPGKQCMVHVLKGGRLEDDPATTHGIRTRERDFGA
jgi:hypothetical protein